MAITRTAKGTASSKAATTSLTLSSVSLTAGDVLVVGIGYETDFDLSSVKWGGKELRWNASRGQTQGDTRCRIYHKRIRKTATRDITATWAGNMSARALFATALTEVGRVDVDQKRAESTATGAPATGTAVTSTVADTISIAAFVSLGPSGDTAGTAGVGHTLGQRVGTTGAPPGSNVTIQETFEILSATGNVRATMTGATSREWASVIAAFRSSQTFTVVEGGQVHRDQNENPDWVVFQIDDEATGRLQVRIDPDDFDAWSDQEVTDRITDYCTNYAERLDGESNIDIDSARDTRIATFVNDTVIL